MTRALKVLRLRTEYAEAPLGIDNEHPRFSWDLRASHRGVSQSAYQIWVSESESALVAGDEILWDSGKISCRDSILRPYGGSPLKSRHRYYFQVRVWDQDAIPSDWSAPSWWEMGLLDPLDWTASWIAAATSSSCCAPLLRREFQLRGPIVRARVYVTCQGLYQLYLNGSRVGTDELRPGFTSYHKRLQYQTYDVTDLISLGPNAVGAVLGEGWYAGEVGIGWQTHRYGNRTSLLLQLEATYGDGTCERTVTDKTWKSKEGPIRMSAIYAGETYDARLEQPGWDQPNFDDQGWSAVSLDVRCNAQLIAQNNSPVRKAETIRPRTIVTSRRGETIVDMGQNMVGWLRMSVEGPAGTTVSVRVGEVLDANGDVYTANLVNAQQTLTYVLRGIGTEVFEPHFTFQGFRYAAIRGYPGELTPDRLTGIVLRSAMDLTGEFECSDPLINQLQQNIVWSMKGNFVDIPSDCPQRDERLGWTGDAQIFAQTAAFNANVAGFFGKWLADLCADQHEDGNVPWVIPDVLGIVQNSPITELNGKPAAGAAGWGDAAVIIPWTLYQVYGDIRFLRDHYESMTRWTDYEAQRAARDLIWRRDFQFGDWAALNGGSTDTALIATAFFAHSVDLMSRASRVLGNARQSVYYEDLFANVRSAFNSQFVKSDGKIGSDTQTGYVLALQFELLRGGQRSAAGKRLAEKIRQEKSLATGFLGTPWLLFALSEHGYLNEAYELLLRRECPSWLYPITRGATTIWEQWNGIRPDGSFFDPNNNSFNHYAYGAVGDWMYRVVGGIRFDPESPGYKHVIIQPQPGGGLTHARAAYMSEYGRVSSGWKLEGEEFRLEIEIPENTSATVHLPCARREELLEGGLCAAIGNGIASINHTEAGVVVEVGSGRFVFRHRRHGQA